LPSIVSGHGDYRADTSGVDDVLPIDPEWVVDQARAMLEDVPVAAFKIGLLAAWKTSRR